MILLSIKKTLAAPVSPLTSHTSRRLVGDCCAAGRLSAALGSCHAGGESGQAAANTYLRKPNMHVTFSLSPLPFLTARPQGNTADLWGEHVEVSLPVLWDCAPDGDLGSGLCARKGHLSLSR